MKNKENSEELEGQLVDKHYGLVVTQALRFSSNKQDLEDHIQVGLIGLVKAIRNYDSEKSKFSTFATTCIKNEIFRYIRKNKKKPLPHIVHTRSILGKNADFYTAKDPLWELIPDSLNDQEKLVLYLKTQNYTHKEIAETLSCTKNHVKNVVRKLISILKKADKNEEKKDTAL